MTSYEFAILRCIVSSGYAPTDNRGTQAFTKVKIEFENYTQDTKEQLEGSDDMPHLVRLLKEGWQICHSNGGCTWLQRPMLSSGFTITPHFSEANERDFDHTSHFSADGKR